MHDHLGFAIDRQHDRPAGPSHPPQVGLRVTLEVGERSNVGQVDHEYLAFMKFTAYFMIARQGVHVKRAHRIQPL